MKQIAWSLGVLCLLTSPSVYAQAKASVPIEQVPNQLETTSSILSLVAANELLQAGQTALQAQDFATAVEKTSQAVTMFNQLSTFHEALAKAMNGIDNRVYEEEKQQALAAAIKRDIASYQLAVIHRSEGKPDLAVPLLVRVIASQGVYRDLGKQAYQQLYDQGFVKSLIGQNPADATLPVTEAPPEGSMSLGTAEKLIQEGRDAAQQSNFALAIEKTTQAITLLNQLTTFHESLSKALSGIDSRVTEEEKQLALAAAIKRDEAGFQLALVHRAEGKPELSVPLLVRIVSSQGVDRKLGLQAYQQLFELRFVKTLYTR